MKSILRYVYRKLLPANISRSIDIFSTLRMPQVDGLKERKVLVLSPHPDDDIIACGGIIHQYHLSGTDVTSVYMTDGRKGNPRYEEDKLVSVRKEEAESAASTIGIDRLIFLDNRDSELSLSPKTTNEMSAILNDLKPEAVLLPFLMDNHTDHIETNKIFLSSLNSSHSFMCYAYGIWNPLSFFNLHVDITPYIDLKIKAMEEHRSQTEVFDLVGASLGLTKYYSVMRGGNGWAEVFIACSSDEYKRVTEAIDWQRNL